MSTIAEHLAELEMLHANRTEGISNVMVQAGYMFLIVHYEEMIQERDPTEMAKAREIVEQRLREQHPARADEHIEKWRAARPALRTAPTSAAGATKPDELTSSPEPAPALRAAEWVDEAMRLAERIEAAGARRGREGKAPSDHEPEMHALRTHLSRASGLLPVAREGLSDEQLHALWVKHVGTHTSNIAFARAIEAAHGIAPASGDAPGEAK